MIGKKTTIYDISKMTGYSPSTVSRVLSKSEYPVAERTRDAIVKSAVELDYQTDLIARNLKTKTSNTIGVVVPTTGPMYMAMVQGMEDAAYENGYTIFLLNHKYDPDRTRKYIQTLVQSYVSGVICMLLKEIPEGCIPENSGCPVLMITSGNTPKGELFVDLELENSTYLATKHLISLGHKKIAYLTLNKEVLSMRQLKIAGYKKALGEAGIVFSERYLYETQNCHYASSDSLLECEVGVELTRKLIINTPEVTGIVCMNDLVAIAALRELTDSGYRVPFDYSVTGCDDLFFARLIRPSLTTVQINKYDMGRRAMLDLIQYIQNGIVHSRKNDKDIRLIKRESSSFPRHA